MATEVTEEMRRAVYAADCEALGHIPDANTAIVAAGPARGGGGDVGGPDDETLPHMRCRRCGSVWLMWPERFDTYAAAVTAVRGLLKDPAGLQPKKRPPRPTSTRPAGG